MSALQKAFVVGMGHVGRSLAGTLERAGVAVHGVGREQGWPEALDATDPAPRIVAVREDDLGAVLGRFPDAMRRRLVLVCNGFLEAVHGDLRPASRGLIWYNVRPGFFRNLRPSLFWGSAVPELVRALDAGGLPVARVDDDDAFVRELIVKGVWNCVVGLPLAVHKVDLATYLRDSRQEWEALVAESARAASAAYGVDVPAAAVVRTIENTTAEIGDVRGGTKALDFRGGAIAAFGRRHGVPTSVTDGLLRAVGYDPDRRAR